MNHDAVLLDIQPIVAPTRGFTRNEFEQRLASAQANMRLHGMDALLLTTEADIHYYSGFQTQFWQSPTRPWFLLVPQSGQPIAIIPTIGLACMGRTWVEDIRCWSSPDPDDEGIGLLAESIRQTIGNNANLGTPMGRETYLRMPLADFDQLKRQLPLCQWSDATTLLQTQRQIKSGAEIEKIRHCCTLASTAFERLPDFLAPGQTEQEVFSIFKQLCLRLGVDDVTYLVGGSGNGGYSDIISPATTRTLQHNDVLILDTGCQWDGYFCDFDRNYCVGTTSKAAQDAYKIVWDATQAGLECVKPGISCADVFRVMNQHMAKHNRDTGGEVGRLGHGLGLQLTETPSVAAFEQTILKEGMVLTLEPGYTFEQGKMMVHEENIVVCNNGAELLSRRAAQTMPVI